VEEIREPRYGQLNIVQGNMFHRGCTRKSADMILYHFLVYNGRPVVVSPKILDENDCTYFQ
jgi:hypothetical protein